jgi:hypothetical protein
MISVVPGVVPADMIAGIGHDQGFVSNLVVTSAALPAAFASSGAAGEKEHS